MLPLSVLISFFVSSLLLAAAPGPDIVFVLTQSLASGKKAGLWVAFGNVMALLVHTVIVAVGLGELIKSSPQTLEWIKIIGASYLIYIAVRIFMTAGSTDLNSGEHDDISTKNLFVRGAIVSLTNPQVTLLFVAFLPGFVDKRLDYIPLQFISLGLVFMAAAMLVFSVVAMASGLVREKVLNSPNTMKFIDRAAGVVFLCLAMHLFMDQLLPGPKAGDCSDQGGKYQCSQPLSSQPQSH